MPTTANSITYYVAADGTLRDGPQGSISQQPRINYGTNYAVTLSFPPSTIAEGDQLQVALNRTRTFFSSASATGDAPVAAVVKHDVTAEEAAAQAVMVVLSTNTRAMIDQVNGIDHPVRGFFGIHVLRGQSFVTLAVADALMMSLESGPDAISPSLPVVDYPTREEAVALAERSEAAAGRAETAQGKAEEAQGKAETAEGNAQIWAEGTDQQVEELGGEHSAKEWAGNAGQSAGNAGQSATNAAQSATDANTAKGKAEDAQSAAENAQGNAAKIAEGSDADVSPFGLEHSAKGWAEEAAERMTVITIPAATTAYALQDNKHYQQVPSAVPTYTLPTASFDGLVHEITVLVDFMHVTSCSFVDASGVPVTLQSAISPSIGEAYIFRCYWYGKWRVVPLKIRNAATASSATGVVEVSDAVAGDALALKMVASRSVVVNQHINATDTSVTLTSGRTWMTYIGGVGAKVTGEGQSVTCTGGTDMAVDLTQYFNGDTTLINSIQTWDDLVAYDPRFASYVEYNTGTVEGVQPQVKVTGKNLFDIPRTADTFTQQTGVRVFDLSKYYVGLSYSNNSVPSRISTHSISNATIQFTTSSTGGNGGIAFPFRCFGNTSYALSVTSASGNMRVSFYTTDGEYISAGNVTDSTVLLFTTPSNCGIVVICFYSPNASTSVTYVNPQLELGSTATTYEPYHDGGTAQAPAPLFAVGNAADEYEAVSGVTTRKMGSYTFTWNDTWYGSGGVYSTPVLKGLVGNLPSNGWKTTGIILPGYLPATNVSTSSADCIFAFSYTGNLYIKNTLYATKIEFVSNIAGKTIYYELATPTTSQSTPTQISLQAGNNVALQTDGGRTLAELSLTYENLPSDN